MTVLEPFTPNPVNVSSGGNTTVDGSSSPNNKVMITSMGANFDAEVFIDAYDGSTWVETRQLGTEGGLSTLEADWDTQGNRILCVANERRLRIENVGTTSGNISFEGDILE